MNLFCILPILANEIKIINVEGNQRISKEAIIIFSEVKPGMEYSDDFANKSLKKIYETNFFENVELSYDNKNLFIKVIENPIIEELTITGIKNKTFLEFIKERMTLRDRSSFNDFNFKNDIRIIEDILKSNGYYFSNIDIDFDKNKELNSIILRINIDLGNKAKIRNISFIGNKVFKDKKLTEVIASEEHKFWKFISKNVYLNQSLINLDKRLLENYYKNRGYYDVQILDNFVELDSKNLSFKLIYNIDAGKKFNIHDLSLDLPPDYNKNDFSKLFKIFEASKGDVYSKEFINQILIDIENIASTKSYDFIDVKVEEFKTDKNKLNFNFIVSDSEKYYIEKINIAGNYSTIEDVIRNKLIVDEGDPLNNLLFNKSINEIRALGFFKNVKSDIKDGSSDNLKSIDIIVEEQPTGEISIAAGIGTDGLQMGGQLNEKNFLGQGISLDTEIEISKESLKGQLSYSKPNFASTDHTLTTSLRSLDNDFLSLYGYKSQEIGFTIGTRFEQFENLYFSPELDFKYEDLSTNNNASANIKKQDGEYSDFYFIYGLDNDLRDSSFDPKKGYLINFKQSLPVISENNEISNTFIFTKYKELNKNTEMVGRASLYLNSINTVDSSDVRISKRAVVPYNRLRGFKKGKIGPVDNQDYIGGNYVSTLNLSTNLPGILPTLENIDFNYFIDLANIWGVDYDSSLDDSKIRSSTGVALNMVTPVGPLSFSFSQPITKSSLDQTEKFRFNLGTTF
jgi:outer membrane protein insertion porin family